MCMASLGYSRSPINGKSRRCRLGHVISCVQSQLISWDMYTDHQGTDSVYQCQLVPPISATYQCHLSVPYMSAAFQCQQ
ncbi:unnamed protein product [Staurois parvus]|uniref:Uncharacterized protein n=1 Tax=Staurois parvus TaxID=386267 RepID=A0ABN9CHZ6_9NEOB|nr:unnamed protein product [Staurois parvus]